VTSDELDFTSEREGRRREIPKGTCVAAGPVDHAEISEHSNLQGNAGGAKDADDYDLIITERA